MYYTDYINFFQVRMELGIADHIWLDKRAAIAQTVDVLGDEFKPAMRAGWMAYIRKAYPDGSASGRNAVGISKLGRCIMVVMVVMGINVVMKMGSNGSN